MARELAVDEATAFLRERLEIIKDLPIGLLYFAVRRIERKRPDVAEDLKRRFGVHDLPVDADMQTYLDKIPLAMLPAVRTAILQVDPSLERLWRRVLSEALIEDEIRKCLGEAVSRFGNEAVYAAGCKLGFGSAK